MQVKITYPPDADGERARSRARRDELLQMIGHRLRGRVAIDRQFLDHPHHDPLERARHLGRAAMQRDRRIAANALRGGAAVLGVAALERARSAEQLVENDAEREDVAPRVDVLAEDLLR